MDRLLHDRELGLVIGRGSRAAGGLRCDTAARLQGGGLIQIRDGRAFPTQGDLFAS